MATTLEDLEKRLAAVEQELAELRGRVEELSPPETPAEAGARMIHEAERSQAELTAAWDKAMEQMGIRGEPIPAEELQARILARGVVKPEDNEFSRAIIEMREE